MKAEGAYLPTCYQARHESPVHNQQVHRDATTHWLISEMYVLRLLVGWRMHTPGMVAPKQDVSTDSSCKNMLNFELPPTTIFQLPHDV